MPKLLVLALAFSLTGSTELAPGRPQAHDKSAMKANRRPVSAPLSVSDIELNVAATVQESDAQKRSEEMLALFNKKKHKVGEKFGVRKEKYKEIHSEPVVRHDLRDYAGTYEVHGLGYTIRIETRSAGEAVVTGYEPQAGDAQRLRRFRLADLRLDGALLTGTKVYEDGAREKFEGLFINMTDIEGVSPTQIEHRATTFGLGVVGVRIEMDGVTSDKIFYQFKQ